ncbi:MAG TPA: fibrillarin-like rRNA/tRNA 2'-O-methyltransferase, partial [Candidatus Norongarragalinales archaeon]|nr:fibrillarin-like rRNA/tRNA 2'-O-methyltransferase [Candidatus Norongarragalinales archaeon]
ILADALSPESYVSDVGAVDVVYEDVAAKSQAEILLRNCELLKKGGFALLAIKSQSIDSAAPPEKTYRQVLEKLSELDLLETIKLDPLEKDHLFCVFRKP